MTDRWSGHAPDLVRDNRLMHERIAEQDREIARLTELLRIAESKALPALPEVGVGVIPFTHWSKDPLIPYANCKCVSCEDARQPVEATSSDSAASEPPK